LLRVALGLLLLAAFPALGAGAGFFSVEVQIQGSGSVALEPRAEFYSAGSVVMLTATPARWYGFDRWSDGDPTNPRSLTVSEDTTLAAVFTNSIPLEVTPFKTRQWDRSYGGDDDDQLLFLLPTADGGWILAGDSWSSASDGKTTAGCGSSDFWILKTDREGRTVWERSLGGDDRERLAFVQPVEGGSLLVGGYSTSGADCTKHVGRLGKGDFWIIKIDATGDTIWEQELGGTESEQFPMCRPTADGGAVIVGYTDSGVGGNKTTPAWGGFDFWVVKLGGSGEKEWEQTLGGSGDDFPSCLLVTASGEILVGGSTASRDDGNKSAPPLGGFDFWVVKLNPAGEIQWNHAYGGTGDDILSFAAADGDDGVLLAGYSGSGASGTKTAAGFGEYDFWVVRIDAEGSSLWDFSFGGSRTEVLTTLLPVAAGGFLLGGTSESETSGNKSTAGHGGSDYWVVRIDESGNPLWEQTYGGSGDDVLLSLRQTRDSGFVLSGYSLSFRSGNKRSEGLGASDYWVIKTGSEGAREWEQTLGGTDEDVLYSVQETQNGDLICAGYSQSEIGRGKDALRYGGLDYWVVKLVSLELPIGTPLIFVNDEWLPSGGVTIGDLAEIRIESSFPGGSIFYTLDGSSPGTNSIPYGGPFSTNGSVTVRALAVTGDPPGSALADPVQVSVLPTYDLNVTTAGGGEITRSPSRGPYLSNSVVVVTAVAEPGWIFLRWRGENLPATESVSIVMDRDYSFEAEFGTPVVALSASNGSAQVDPDTALHPFGSLVRFTAFPDPGYYFSVWEAGAGLVGNANPVELPVTVGDFAVLARFAPLAANQVALVTPVLGAGSVRADPSEDYYTTGATITLTATSSAGHIFVGWDMDGSGYENPLGVQLNGSKTIRATFMSPGFHVAATNFITNGFLLELVGPAGSAVQIDRSPDLVNWTPLIALSNSPPLLKVLDPGSAPSGRRFYRYRTLP